LELLKTEVNRDMKIPFMNKIVAQRNQSGLSAEEIEVIIRDKLAVEFSDKQLSGKKVGILTGSRGIRNLQCMIKTVIKELKQRGAQVVILPAMGSHGGATAQGQSAILDHYGINEVNLGVPIVADMETTVVDDLNGYPVYVASKALELDCILPINRVKAHTDFHSDHESGIVKMLVIGLGKKDQAEAVHQHGLKGLQTLIPKVAAKILEHVSLLAGIAVIENKDDETEQIEILNKNNIFKRERELLQYSKTMLPKLPANHLDVLVVRQMGKNISGVGIDPNVTGRIRINGAQDEAGTASRIAVLDLTVESDGNALGMGIADIITKRLFDKVDIEKTYMNTITSGFLERCFIPVVAPTDQRAVEIGLQACGRFVTEDTARIMVINNTIDLAEIYVSPALLPEISPDYKLVSANTVNLFDKIGNLIWQ
jgi:Uncharacterized conserved protein (DUF2088).